VTEEETREEQPEISRKRFLRSVSGQGILTLISRILGLVREQMRAFFLGASNESDAFGLAVMIPNLFRRLLGEGQMTAAFLPSLVEKIRAKDRQALRKFYSDFLGVFTFIVTIVVIVGYLITPWIIDTWFARANADTALTIRLTRVMFPYLGLVTTAAILQATLQAHHLFWPGAATPIFLNLSIIGCAYFFADSFEYKSYAFAMGFLVGGCIQLLFQVPFVLKKKFSLRPRFGWRNPSVRRVLRIFLPGILAGGIYQLQVLVSQGIAYSLGTGRVSALQYSIRLQELVLGVFVISVTTVVLPTLSAQIADDGDNSRAAEKTFAFSTSLMAMITIPATIGLLILGPSIIRLLFQYGAFTQHDNDLVYKALIFHSIGLLPIALSRNVMQVYYAKKDLRTPMLVSGYILIQHVILCLILSRTSLDHGGIALSTAIGATVNVGILSYLLNRSGFRIIDRSLGKRLLLCLVAAGIMFAGVWGIAWSFGLFDQQTTRLTLGIGLGCAVLGGAILYTIALLTIRHPDALQAYTSLKARLSSDS